MHKEQGLKLHGDGVSKRKGGFLESKVSAISEEKQEGKNHIAQRDEHDQAQSHPDSNGIMWYLMLDLLRCPWS